MSNPVVFEPVAGSTISVNVTATSALSAAIGTAKVAGEGPQFKEVVRLRSTVDTCITFETAVGAGATAQTTHMELTAGQFEYFEITPGCRIAAIRAPSAAGDGVLKITRVYKGSTA